MKNITLTYLKVLDHFETEYNAKVCAFYITGEVKEENEDYLYIRKLWWVYEENNEPSREQIEGVVKSTIKYRKDIEIEVEE